MDETLQSEPYRPDSGLCETVCRESGWLGELLLLALFALRAAYVQRRWRSAETEKASLQEKVAELSIRPPAGPTTLQIQLAPNPGAHELLGATVSMRPADPLKPASTAGNAPSEGTEASDPDWVGPTDDGH